MYISFLSIWRLFQLQFNIVEFRRFYYKNVFNPFESSIKHFIVFSTVNQYMHLKVVTISYVYSF